MSNKKNIKNNLINKKINFDGIYNNNEENIILNLDDIINYYLEEGKFLNVDGTFKDDKLLNNYDSELNSGFIKKVHKNENLSIFGQFNNIIIKNHLYKINELKIKFNDNKLFILGTIKFINFFKDFFYKNIFTNLNIYYNFYKFHLIKFPTTKELIYFEKDDLLKTIPQRYHIELGNHNIILVLEYYYIINLKEKKIYINYKFPNHHYKEENKLFINLIINNYSLNNIYGYEWYEKILDNLEKYYELKQKENKNKKTFIFKIFQTNKNKKSLEEFKEKILFYNKYYESILNNKSSNNLLKKITNAHEQFKKENELKYSNRTITIPTFQIIKNNYEILFFNKKILYEFMKLSNKKNIEVIIKSIKNNTNNIKEFSIDNIDENIYNILKKITYLRFYFRYSDIKTLKERFKENGKKKFDYIIDYNKSFKEYLSTIFIDTKNNYLKNIIENYCTNINNINNDLKNKLNEKVDSEKKHYENINYVLKKLNKRTNRVIDYCIILDIKKTKLRSINEINKKTNITLMEI